MHLVGGSSHSEEVRGGLCPAHSLKTQQPPPDRDMRVAIGNWHLSSSLAMGPLLGAGEVP